MSTNPQSSAELTDALDTCPAILLVEDEPTTRMLMERQLARAGYCVTAVSNGAEAIAVLKNKFFPLLITDWDMPEMNGVTLCKTIRELPLQGYVYTILLTAREGKANMLEGLTSGADDYLTKPPDDAELRARLNNGKRILKLEKSLRIANHRIRSLSITDALTNTYNRHYLMERLPQEIATAYLSGRPISVVICDVDHFKRVNDTYGHQAGDGVLRRVATALVDATRADLDWVARYGGEEFLLVLADTGPAEATMLAERIRARIEGLTFEDLDESCRVTASFGVAGHEASATMSAANMDALIGEADRHLYRSKQAGRNRVMAG